MTRITGALLVLLSAGCVPAGPEARWVFLVTHLEVHQPVTPAAGGRLVSRGFDLDGIDSERLTGTRATCSDRAFDYVSELDPMGVGIDNYFGPGSAGGPSLPEPADTTAADAVAAGLYLVALEIAGMESMVDDAEVELRLVPVSLFGCGTPPCPVLLDPAGLAAHRFVAGEPLGVGAGSVANGVLTASLERWTIPFEAHRFEAPAGSLLTMERVRISATLAPQELIDGNVGAGMSLDEYARVASVVAGGDPADWRRNAELVADLAAPGTSLPCTHVSAGYSLEARAIVVVP